MKHLKIAFSFFLALLFIVAVGVMAIQTPGAVSADAVTNYYVHTVAAGSTAYITTGGNLTGWDVSGYGSAVVHAIADSSNTTSTLTVYPQFTNQTAVCTGISSNWFTGTDYIPYSIGATYYAPIAYTVNSTDSLAWTSTGSTTITGSSPYVVTTTYTYGSASALGSAASGYNSSEQSMTVTGDDTAGKEFRIYGRCMRLKLAVSFGTITPTIYVMERDLY